MDVESMKETQSQFPHQRGGVVQHGSNPSTEVGEKGEGFSGVLWVALPNSVAAVSAVSNTKS